MTKSKSPRQNAWDGLAQLSRDRVDTDAPLNEIFHWGLLAPDGRNPINDRPTALVAAAVVEQSLEHALLTRFPHRNSSVVNEGLFEGRGAILRDFASKISMAYLMDIVGKQTRSDLSAIRHIRNAFAHSRLNINFDTPELQEACKQITLPYRWKTMMDEEKLDDLREVFIQTCFEYSVWLFTYETYANKKSKHERWPRDHLSA